MESRARAYLQQFEENFSFVLINGSISCSIQQAFKCERHFNYCMLHSIFYLILILIYRKIEVALNWNIKNAKKRTQTNIIFESTMRCFVLFSIHMRDAFFLFSYSFIGIIWIAFLLYWVIHDNMNCVCFITTINVNQWMPVPHASLTQLWLIVWQFYVTV